VPGVDLAKQAVRRRWRALGFLSERSSVKVQLSSTGLERRTSKARTNAVVDACVKQAGGHQVVWLHFSTCFGSGKIAYVHFKWAGVGCSVRMNKDCEAFSYPW